VARSIHVCRMPTINEILKSPMVAVDTETDEDQPPCKTALKGLSLAWGNPEAPEGCYWSFERDPAMWDSVRKKFIEPLFASTGVQLAFWNAKFDLQVFKARDLVPKGTIIDGMMLHYLLDEDDDHGLKDRARADLGAQNAKPFGAVKREMRDILKKGDQNCRKGIQSVWAIYKRERLKSKVQEPKILDTWSLAKRVAWSLPPGMKKEDVVARADAKIRPITTAEATAKRDERFAEYGRNDAVWTLQLTAGFLEEVKKEGFLDLFFNLEMPVVKEIARIETRGVKLDRKQLVALRKMYSQAANALLSEFRSRHGDEFNPASPDQMRKLFWVEKGIKAPDWAMTTKKAQETGDRKFASVNADVLEWIAAEHKDEDASAAVRLRRVDKILSTYIIPLHEISKADGEGRVHTSFNPVGTPNDRWSSSDPNLQNQPRPGTTEDVLPNAPSTRTVFIPTEGYSFVIADFSQIELRMMAHYSQDKNLLSAYRSWKCFTCGSTGETNKPLLMCPECWEERLEWRKAEKAGRGFALGRDIHWETGVNTPLVEHYGPEEGRQRAKSTNFGLIYGMGAKLLAKQIDVPLEIAEEVHESYFARYPNVLAFHRWVERVLVNRGWFKLLTGRVRHFMREKRDYANGVYDGQDAWLFYRVIREAVNSIIQGGAAGLMKEAICKLAKIFDGSNKYGDTGIVLQVHDELVIETPDRKVKAVAAVVQKTMENTHELRVPVLADVHYGKRWEK